MPLQRHVLFPINGNRVRGLETSLYARGKVAGLYIVGLTQRAIIEATNLSRSSIRGAIALDILNTNRASLPRPGRPIIYDPRDRRAMLRNIRLHPKLTFDARREATGLDMSNSYIKGLARSEGLTHWRAKKRPELTEEVAALRLA